MEKRRILIVSDPSRHEESDVENAFNALIKYCNSDEYIVSIESIWSYDHIAWKLIDRKIWLPRINNVDVLLHNCSYERNNLLVLACDVLILFPSLDRRGFLEDLERKWRIRKGYDNLEVL